MLQKLVSSKIIVAIIVIIFGSLFFVAFWFGTGQFADVLRGYEIINQMNAGGKFNTLNYPSVVNFNYTYYVSWWSPAQWFFVYCLMKMGLSIQLSQVILILVFVGLGLYFYRRLFLLLQFSTTTSWLSILIILSTGFVGNQFILYSGGDLFVFAFLPFFLNLFVKSFTWSFLRFLGVFIPLGVFLLFLKNSFLLIIFASLVAFWLINKKKTIPLAFYGISILVVAYFFHLRFDETPGSAIDLEGYYGIPNSILGDLVHPASSWLNSMFNIDAILGVFEKMNLIETESTNLLFIPFAIFSIWILVKVWREEIVSNEQRRFVFLFSIIFTSIFVVLFLRNSAISYDVRHFAPANLVLVPFFLDLGRKKSPKEF